MKLTSAILAAALLAAPAALAQTPAPQSPAATAPDGQFYAPQANDMRVRDLLNAKVQNAANESVGDINDIILNKDGKVTAVVIGVGGFLGMGERDVALSYSSLRFAKDSNGRDVITVNATKDQLKNAPAWQATKR